MWAFQISPPTGWQSPKKGRGLTAAKGGKKRRHGKCLRFFIIKIRFYEFAEQ